MQEAMPCLCEVIDIADRLLVMHSGEPVGKRWAEGPKLTEENVHYLRQHAYLDKIGF